MALSRVLEPEVMDSADEADDYDAIDHSVVNAAFVTDLLACGVPEGDVVDLGTGTALIPIELCRRNPVMRVMACDAAIAMLELARYNLEIAGVTDRVQLSNVDAKQLPFGDQSFDIVMSNSIVHHIPEPASVLREAVRVAKRGGLIFFRDLLRPVDDATVERLVAEHAADSTDSQRKMFEASLRAALNLDEIRALIRELGYAADTVQTTSDRHWTWIARK